MLDFKTYDKENQEIWEKFVEIAKEAKRKGFIRYSSKGIFEILRWQTKVHGNDGWKVNNSYTADYARKLEETHKEFKGFFVKRELKTTRIK